MPLTRDTAGARHPGISRGGALYCRAKLVCAARRKCANTPCAAARSPLALRPLPPKGRRSFWFKGFPRAASGLYSPLPAQPTRAEGREGGLLDTISWLASPAAGWLAFDFAFLLIFCKNRECHAICSGDMHEKFRVQIRRILTSRSCKIVK